MLVEAVGWKRERGEGKEGEEGRERELCYTPPSLLLSPVHLHHY